jgi:hypothetical protein
MLNVIPEVLVRAKSDEAMGCFHHSNRGLNHASSFEISSREFELVSNTWVRR